MLEGVLACSTGVPWARRPPCVLPISLLFPFRCHISPPYEKYNQVPGGPTNRDCDTMVSLQRNPVTLPVTLPVTRPINMKVPIQLWVPKFQIGPVDEIPNSDLIRAELEWRGEQRIWLSTVENKVTRWKTQKGPLGSECIVPADTDNVIDVYHVDKSGLSFPPLKLPSDWGDTLPEGLYQLWLNVMPKTVEGPRTISMEFPTVGDEGVSYVTQTFKMDPGSIVPIVGIDEDKRLTRMAWPPPDLNTPRTISPESESRRHYGRLDYARLEVDGREREVVSAEGDPEMLAINFWQQWPEPFGSFFQDGGGLDLLSHQAFMRRCILNWEAGRRHEALQEAQTWVSELTGEVETSMELAWFMPRVSGSIEVLLTDVSRIYGVNANNLDDLLNSEDFLINRQSVTKCTRAQGWLGYFWLELYADISDDVTVKFCRNCGRVMRGGRIDRMYCSQRENESCVRERGAARTRRSRRSALS